MNNRTNYVSKGALSWAVMLMLMVALIAGQVRAGLEADTTSDVEPLAEHEFRLQGGSLDKGSLDKVEFIIIDALLPLAINVWSATEPDSNPVQQ